MDPATAKLFFLMERGRRVGYLGKQKTEIYFGPRRLDGVATVKQFQGCVRTELLEPDRMKGMVILERGSHRVIRRPHDTTWHSRPTGSEESRSSRRLLGSYTLRNTGTATLAGRAATIVEIKGSQPPDRPSRKVWLDNETGVVLRAEVYSHTGKLVSTSEFQEIDYKAQLSPDEFALPHLNAEDEPQELTREQAASLPRPNYLPPGYGFAGRPRKLHTPRGDAYHLRYTDGLSVISVFLRKMDAGEAAGGRPPMVEPFSRGARATKGGYGITVLGDIDTTELQRIADSVQP